MYDVYGKIGDEFDRLVIAHRAALPAGLSKTEWRLLGRKDAAAKDIADEVTAKGYCRYRTNVPFDEGNTLGHPPWR